MASSLASPLRCALPMIRQSLLAAVVLAFASSTIACASPDGAADENVGTQASAMSEAPESAVKEIATTLLGAVAGKGAMESLFPAEGVDYARLNATLASTMKQANVNQTVMEQTGRLVGLEAYMRDCDTRLAAGADSDGIYREIFVSLSTANEILANLSTPETSQAGLSAYIGAAQLRMSMTMRLAQLKPSALSTSLTSIRRDAVTYARHVVDTKKAIELGTLDNRLSQMSECKIEGGGFSGGATFRDNDYAPMYDGQFATESEVMNQCNADRYARMADAGRGVTLAVQVPISWMNDVVQTWNQISGASTILVDTATYGGNTGMVAAGNVSPQVSAECTNESTCAYTVKTSRLGDRAFNKAKDFAVTYWCVDANGTFTSKSASLGAEASGQTVTLACP